MTAEETIKELKDRIYLYRKNWLGDHWEMERCLETYEVAIEALEKVEEYKHLEEQGLLLRLPVKIGDTIYIIDGDEEEDWIDEYEVKYFYISSRGVNRIYCTCGTATKNIKPKYIGKTVFFTREAAEQKLKELEE